MKLMLLLVNSSLVSHKVVIIIPCVLVFPFALAFVSVLALAKCLFMFFAHTFMSR